MNYDPNKYRALGVGEKIDGGRHFQVDDDTGGLTSCSYLDGLLVSDSDEFTIVEPIKPSDPIEAIAKEIGLQTDIGKKALRIALANIQVLDQKQQDYGSANIAAFGEYGVLVRVWDKVSRLRNLLTNVSTPKNESIEDTWLDLCNYSIIATLCRRGEWR